MKRKNAIKYFFNIFLVFGIVLFISFSGCSSREQNPVLLSDSTIVYPPKSPDDIQPTVLLSTKVGKKTGKPVNAGTSFYLSEKSNLYAVVELGKRNKQLNKDLMFHIDWIGPNGRSFYTKQINFTADNKSSRISSSVSLSPAKRKEGEYKVRVYLFRELIAEKLFRITDALQDTGKQSASREAKLFGKDEVESVREETTTKPASVNISAKIILCRKVSKKTGKPIGAGTIFTIKEKEKVIALVDIEYRKIKTNEQMIFYFDWIGRNGKSFYKKRIIYTTSNPFFTISNSISIAPEKRKPGNYKVRVYLDDQLIAEQKFELIANIK